MKQERVALFKDLLNLSEQYKRKTAAARPARGAEGSKGGHAFCA